MLKNIKETIQKFSMLKKGNRALVAVSGGPDSISLLLALGCLKKQLGIKLYAAHLNHKLRGAESDKDERYVKKLTDRFNIPLFAESRDVSKFAKAHKMSLEQAAREVRYDFLLKTAKGIGANKIAVAHTKDDQAETLLMRLIRGSGLRGLRAIPPAREISPNIFIIRPLIEITRKQVLSYLKKKKIKPRLDSSNLDFIFLRNRIRHKLLPFIEKHYSPNIRQVLARTAQVLDADYAYLIKQQEGAFKKIAKIKNNKSISLPLKKLNSLSLSLKRGAVRIAIKNTKGDLNRIDYKHWQMIDDLILKGKSGSALHLPEDLRVIKGKNIVEFILKGKAKNSPMPRLPVNIKSALLKIPPKAFSASSNTEWFDADKIAFPIKPRFIQPFDKMKPLGMKTYKRLQDIFVDDKIKAKRRSKIPIIVDAKDRIIWIAGVRMSEDFKLTPRTKNFLRLTIC